MCDVVVKIMLQIILLYFALGLSFHRALSEFYYRLTRIGLSKIKVPDNTYKYCAVDVGRPHTLLLRGRASN